MVVAEKIQLLTASFLPSSTIGIKIHVADLIVHSESKNIHVAMNDVDKHRIVFGDMRQSEQALEKRSSRIDQIFKRKCAQLTKLLEDNDVKKLVD